ncbi:MAG: hypothetical protein IGR93_11595 [Hydrococcus sp. C42_A2020_068]|uniref:hypothetical protein n=1 Tax=Pleurocapsa sp. PCC 7327 TaxID=118163 RepID=UPI00029FA8DB|nr:hypothetical protein [Pleurocapsa sp. PCC 7327]AFY79170.1 hypothetical protein Ple7327_4027 [Pleurocapsa sp. PCC 7327]MBF2020717.1 hypothetical protein [Hydrococcus sp. C42_A2020_068]
MNAISDRGFKSISWSTVILFALGFWLSGSLILDLLILPSLWASGMMNQAGFASAGYTIFGMFNRIELLCAALVLTGFLGLRFSHLISYADLLQERLSIILSGLLVIIPLIYIYFLTPQMSGLGLNLKLFETTTTMPAAMISLHEGYWLLEVLKLVAGTTLLRWCYRSSCHLS